MTTPESRPGVGRLLLRGLLHLVYPPQCLLCDAHVPGDPAPFCPGCDRALFTDPLPTCPRCAATTGPYANVEGGCVACRGEPFAFDRAFRLGPYDGPLRDVVGRLKHASGEALAELIGRRWAERDGPAMRAEGVALVVPVPLHRWRRWQRGYNQSAALAYGLSRGLRLPYRQWAMRRVRDTPFQTHQTREGRRDNVRGAFAWRGRGLGGEVVLLVDDVMTTGSTASESARVLRAAGAGRVVVAALTRARA